jgi:CBS domain-containing protein
MKAVDVMVRDVVTISPDADVKEAIKLLAEHDISALPVVDADGSVVGIISEGDLIRREEIGTEKRRPWWMEALTPASTLAEEFAKSHGRRVAEVMSTHVVSAGEETPLGEIATLLEKHRIKRVPIMRDGKLVGIVSRSNLIQAVASQHPETDGNAEKDREIRLAVVAAGDPAVDRLWLAQRHRHRRHGSPVGVGRLRGRTQSAGRAGGGRARRRSGLGRDDRGLLNVTAGASRPGRRRHGSNTTLDWQRDFAVGSADLVRSRKFVREVHAEGVGEACFARCGHPQRTAVALAYEPAEIETSTPDFRTDQPGNVIATLAPVETRPTEDAPATRA